MTTQLDPQRREVQALLAAIAFNEARVLEVGCGDGRLTFRYAGMSRLSVGLDPEIHDLTTAANRRPAQLSNGIGFIAASASTLPVRSFSFDIAVLAWSL